MNLHSQYRWLSTGQLVRPSAVLNRVSITSPTKLWNSLSNTCHKEEVAFSRIPNHYYEMGKHIFRIQSWISYELFIKRWFHQKVREIHIIWIMKLITPHLEYIVNHIKFNYSLPTNYMIYHTDIWEGKW